MKIIKSVDRRTFDEMRELNLIKFDEKERNFKITSRDKKGKRKHYYVVDKDYEDYLKTIG